MMKRLMTVLVAGTLMQVSAAQARASEASDTRQWLMMVRTVNTDPAKETEFNTWYDDIDIPDVLKVPGYWRARRGKTMPAVPSPVAQPAEAQQQGHYVALYNIESSAIDKTIIDMLMATWKMLSTGRDTPLLRVTERAYYRQWTAPVTIASAKGEGRNRFLVLERFDVAPGADSRRFESWYNGMSRKSAGDVSGVLRATRYELYRVLMFEPKYAPRFMTVFELEADSEEQARSSADRLTHFDDTERASQGYVARESTLYREIKDVLRR
jgi:hypothetical protein